MKEKKEVPTVQSPTYNNRIMNKHPPPERTRELSKKAAWTSSIYICSTGPWSPLLPIFRAASVVIHLLLINTIIIIIVNFWQATLRPFRSCLLPKKWRYHSVWLQEIGNLLTSVFPNTRAWEQQERYIMKKQTKEVRLEAWVCKDAKRARKKGVPTA